MKKKINISYNHAIKIIPGVDKTTFACQKHIPTSGTPQTWFLTVLEIHKHRKNTVFNEKVKNGCKLHYQGQTGEG